MKRFAQRFIGAGRVRLRINLSSRPYDTVGYSRAGLVLLSILLAGLIVGDLRYAAVIRGQAADLELAVAAARMHDQRVEAQARGEGLELSEAALKRLPGDVTFANQLIAKRGFSWTRFLSDLEQATLPGLSIHSIRLNGKDSLISMGGAALTLKSLTAFIVSLEDHKAFLHAALSRHKIQENGQVEFDLTVEYQDQRR